MASGGTLPQKKHPLGADVAVLKSSSVRGAPSSLDTEMVDALPIPALVFSHTGKVDRVNPGAEAFFQTSARRLLGVKVTDLFGDESNFRPLFERLSEDALSVVSEKVKIFNNNVLYDDVHVSISPFRLLETTYFVLLIYVDGTKQQAPAPGVDDKLSRSASGMSAILAHEVKNPLSGIKGAAQLLDQTVEEGDRQLTSLVLKEVERIKLLIDRMQGFSDPRPVELAAFNLYEVIHDALDACQITETEVIIDADPSLPDVFGNRDLFLQVLVNVISNAIEVQAGAGKLHIRTRYNHDKKIAIMTPSGSIKLPIEVAIQDFGPGIPSSIADCLFDPFVSEKAGGTGLGLALVWSFMQKSQGHIEWENNDKGACFRLYLAYDRGERSKGNGNG